MTDKFFDVANGATKRMRAQSDGTHAEVIATTLSVTTFTATIASGASLSGAVDLGEAKLGAIVMPASWTSAALTFQVSFDGTTYYDLHEFGSEVSVTVTAGKAHRLAMSDWLAVRWLKVRSGSSASPVAQGADRTITLGVAF